MSIYLKIADIYQTTAGSAARHPHAISLQRWATQFAGGSLSLARPWRFVLVGRVSGGYTPVTNIEQKETHELGTYDHQA